MKDGNPVTGIIVSVLKVEWLPGSDKGPGKRVVKTESFVLSVK
jgi:hypothetical protein